jgi:hypothetical protein
MNLDPHSKTGSDPGEKFTSDPEEEYTANQRRSGSAPLVKNIFKINPV